jgi:hypothetical protein
VKSHRSHGCDHTRVPQALHSGAAPVLVSGATCAMRRLMPRGNMSATCAQPDTPAFDWQAPRLIPMDAAGVDEDTDDEDDDEEDDDDDEYDSDEEDDDEAVMAAAVAHRESTVRLAHLYAACLRVAFRQQVQQIAAFGASCETTRLAYKRHGNGGLQVVIEELPAEADPAEAATQKRKADAAAMELPQSSGKKSKKQAEQRQQEQDAAAADAALAAGNIGAEPASSQHKSKAEKAAQKAAAKAVDKAAVAAQPTGAKGSKGETPSR